LRRVKYIYKAKLFLKISAIARDKDINCFTDMVYLWFV